jgi:hypothetical protein
VGSAGLRDANPQTRLGNSHARALRQGTRGVPLDKAIWGMSRVEPNLVAGVVGCPNRLGTVHPNLGEYGQLHCPGSPTVARAACAWASARYLYPAPSTRGAVQLVISDEVNVNHWYGISVAFKNKGGLVGPPALRPRGQGPAWARQVTVRG